MIKVFLVDDQTLVRQGARSLLELSDDIEVIGEAPDGETAIERIPEAAPDVVLLDMRMPVLSGLDVLEHLEQDRESLSALVRALKPGGIVLATVPAFPFLWSAHDEANLHFRRYERPQLRQLVTSAGFNVRELHYFFGWPLPLMYARRFFAHSADDGYQVQIPPRPVNELFRALSKAERWATSSSAAPTSGAS